jgi:ATP-binding cassette subfamily F protein uup
MHVSAWAKRFLFDPAKFRTAVGDLSGGEQARILIARLMLQPADLLILDEPTNDLDIPTLEVLEESLANFPGAIVLVTHDRFMLGRLSSQLIALDGHGNAKHYASYEQWESDRGRAEAPPKKDKTSAASSKPKPAAPSQPEADAPRESKLTYKLQRELDQMEATILEAETELDDLQKQAADPTVMADHARYAEVCKKLGQVQTHVQNLYERWAELEAM